jgi:hypothetical protein
MKTLSRLWSRAVLLLALVGCTLPPAALPPAASPLVQAPDSGWPTYTDPAGFSIQYPPEGMVEAGPPVTITLPHTPATNLEEKYLEISVQKGVMTCTNRTAHGYTPETIPQKSVAINGIAFIREQDEEGAAGSYYQSIAYSTMKGGICVSLGFILHSTNPDNYEPPPPLFDQRAESQVFDQMMATFNWP